MVCSGTLFSVRLNKVKLKIFIYLNSRRLRMIGTFVLVETVF